MLRTAQAMDFIMSKKGSVNARDYSLGLIVRQVIWNTSDFMLHLAYSCDYAFGMFLFMPCVGMVLKLYTFA